MASQSNGSQKQAIQPKTTQQSQPQQTQTQPTAPKKKKTCWIVGLIACCSCCAIILIVIIIILGALAATGISDVPILSPILYKEQQPIRRVIYDQNTIKNFNQRLDNLQQKTATTQSIVMTESELTALLNQDSSGQSTQNIQNIQAVITPDLIELYIKFAQPSRLVITAQVVPEVESGQLKLRFTQAKVGPFNIPESQLSGLNNMLKQNTNNFISPTDQITNIILKNKEMIIYFKSVQSAPVT